MALQANTFTKLSYTTIECLPIRNIVLVVDAIIQGIPASHDCGINGCSPGLHPLQSGTILNYDHRCSPFAQFLLFSVINQQKAAGLLYATLLTEVMLPGLP